jgi:hypothetical protein
MNTENDTDVIEPLGMTCTSADCGSGLHCFLPKDRKTTGCHGGPCRYCGVELVDWKRTNRISLDDIDYVFGALQFERIRHWYWHKPIDERALNHAKKKGLSGMRIAAEKRIRNYIAKIPDAFSARATPKSGNILYYGQHATGTCCRVCVAEWYGIPMNRELTELEIDYFTRLLIRYVEQRLPDLSEEPQKVPRGRRNSLKE